MERVNGITKTPPVSHVHAKGNTQRCRKNMKWERLKIYRKKKMNLEKQRKINLRKDVNDYQSKRNNKKTNLFRNQQSQK